MTAVGFDLTEARPQFAFSASEDGYLRVWDPLLSLTEPHQDSSGGGRSLSDGLLAEFIVPGKARINDAIHIGDRVLPGFDLFLIGDSKGRLFLWDWKSETLRATVRPYADFNLDRAGMEGARVLPPFHMASRMNVDSVATTADANLQGRAGPIGTSKSHERPQKVTMHPTDVVSHWVRTKEESRY